MFINTDQITFGVYEPVTYRRTSGEMEMIWDDTRTARLISFDDSWQSLASFRDLLDLMAAKDIKDKDDIKPIQFVAMLLTCGFEDITRY